jgi:hypothetical protein
MDNDSVMPEDWLEFTGELCPALNISFGKGTLKLSLWVI